MDDTHLNNPPPILGETDPSATTGRQERVKKLRFQKTTASRREKISIRSNMGVLLRLLEIFRPWRKSKFQFFHRFLSPGFQTPKAQLRAEQVVRKRPVWNV
jgi:hypothetical protein